MGDGSEETKRTAFVVHFTDRTKPKYPLKTPSRFHISHNQIRQTGLELNPAFQGERPATGHTNHGTLVMCVCVCVFVCARVFVRACERGRKQIKSFDYRPKLNIIIKMRHLITCGSERTFLYVNAKENLYICCLAGQGSLVVEFRHTI
jgi:hypothetical protein